ncbi:hypothetical protein DFH08DRAFT_692431 [Mycena albidolilacea]|uniref:Uncharacterized protein n=1 Tax=Mycena albidolilacea TaxID=1033008 RepID=A0AAD7EV46_9AGAR|nr:hypothetical protein DFH08DRAFT_692431 [Mycena albidolilacea]
MLIVEVSNPSGPPKFSLRLSFLLIVQLLIGADMNAKGGHYGSVLQAAPSSGSEPIFQLLIANDATVNLQGGYFGSAIQATACCKSEPIVELLIANGANVNARGARYDSALRAALAEGNEIIAGLLRTSDAEEPPNQNETEGQA